MRVAIVVLIGFVVIAAAALVLSRPVMAPVLTAEPTVAVSAPSPTVPPATAPPSPTPSASPSAPGVPGLQMSAVGAIPSDHRYTMTSVRLMLVDTANRKGREVLRYHPGGQPRPVEFSASADGQILALILHPSEDRSVIAIAHPDTAQASTVLEQSGLHTPMLSPEGSRLAYQRLSADAALNGVWMIERGSGTPRRLVADEPQRVGSPPRPIAWSSNGRWLAIAANTGAPGADVVAVVDATAGETRFDAASGTFSGGDARRAARGGDADWADGRLLVTSSTGPLGGIAQVSVYDLATKSATVVYSPPKERSVSGGIWRPNADAFAVIEGPAFVGPGEPLAIWLRGLDGREQRLAGAEFIVDLWWSRDGSKLFGLAGGDDSVGNVFEVFSGATFPICLRGGDAPPCL